MAVCHTELVVRLLEAVLAPSAELDVLVESRALARQVENPQLAVSVDEAGRVDSYVKLGISPVTPVLIEDNGRRNLRKVIEAVRGAGGTLIYVLGTSLADVRKAEALRDDFPEVTTLTLAELHRAAAAHRARPLGDAAARAAVPALHGRRGSRADPHAQRSGSGCDGQRPGAAHHPAPHATDRGDRLPRSP